MDLLDNIATELGFEFHLYVVRDQLFGAKLQRNFNSFVKPTNNKHQNSNNVAQSTQSQANENGESNGE